MHEFFPCPLCRFSIFVFLPFFCFLYTVCATAQASIFTVFWPFSQRNCQIVEDVWTMIEPVVKSKDVRRQTRKLQGVDGRFFTKVSEKRYRKSCKYMCNNSTRLKGKKKLQLKTISKFRAQRYGDIWPTKVGKTWREKRRCTLHAGMASEEFVTYTKGRPAGKRTWCEHSRDHLDYRWWDNIQRSSPQNTGWAKTAITLRLEKCENKHALGNRTFYTSPLRKCKKT